MLGHGLGLAIHEDPLISPVDPCELQPGMILAVELPYYFRFSGGMNVEDVVLVTSDGQRLLSTCRKDF
jgi:Xaa-Pro aminopeptidase/Xaa-Pro dipeptidase